eukprot:GHVU01184330.1.p1 GENE.GHVU01184330.1~~GHVU01184330.1.p1  ORF type:complete len:441 (-),score=75.79 GHVU01184330.1:95-1417(-)
MLVFLHACLSTYMHACLSTYMHACLSTYMHACMPVCLPVFNWSASSYPPPCRLSVCSPGRLLVGVPLCRCSVVGLFVCSFVRLFVCLLVCLLVRLFVCLQALSMLGPVEVALVGCASKGCRGLCTQDMLWQTMYAQRAYRYEVDASGAAAAAPTGTGGQQQQPVNEPSRRPFAAPATEWDLVLESPLSAAPPDQRDDAPDDDAAAVRRESPPPSASAASSPSAGRRRPPRVDSRRQRPQQRTTTTTTNFVPQPNSDSDSTTDTAAAIEEFAALGLAEEEDAESSRRDETAAKRQEEEFKQMMLGASLPVSEEERAARYVGQSQPPSAALLRRSVSPFKYRMVRDAIPHLYVEYTLLTHKAKSLHERALYRSQVSQAMQSLASTKVANDNAAFTLSSQESLRVSSSAAASSWDDLVSCCDRLKRTAKRLHCHLASLTAFAS